MLKTSLIFLLSHLFIFNCPVHTSRIKIVNNGYEDILISLQASIDARNRPRLVSSIKNLLQQSSAYLLSSTKGRASFRSATFLVPNAWGDIDTWLPGRDNTTTFDEAGTFLTRDKADIIITNPNETEHAYTLHHQGCGIQGLRIYLPSSHLLSGNLAKRSVEFVRLWSEFRYGVFPEGGFADDERYPLEFRIPGTPEIRTTDCVNKLFRIPYECETEEECNVKGIRPSIMDQKYNNGTSFCEGHTGLGQIHNPDAPSKQNLLCSEEGAYFTVLRSPDFIKGRNAAPKYQRHTEITYRFVKESTEARIFVGIDISSKMLLENRYTATKSAFSKFVLHDIPDGSELSLLVFGGDTNETLISSSVKIEGESSRIRYLEGQPLPDETSEEDDSCPECALFYMIEYLKNETGPAPLIILVTTALYIDESMYDTLKDTLLILEIRLQVLLFTNSASNTSSPHLSWYSLCKETGNQFIALEEELLRNLFNGFFSTVQRMSKSKLVSQGYLNTLDEENLFFPISIDESLSHSLTISISGTLFHTSPLDFASTVLRSPDRTVHLYPRKQELIPAWTFHVPNPETGIYTLKTRRKQGATSSIFVTATGMPVETEDYINVKIWVEEIKKPIAQPPVQIFCEVRMGPYPVTNATVIAYIYHPDNDGVSEVILLDDGQGSTDITKHDGVYSRFFTNFTTVGFYNVYIKVTGGVDDITTVRKGPSSQCCGSSFPFNEQTVTGQFQREAGPVTFKVESVSEYDSYPPAKVMDLQIAKSYDRMFVLQWTAVGNNFDTGVASTYELKVFRDRSLINRRFFDSGLEIYNETIETTEEATYGTALFHVIKFSQPTYSGVYFVGIRGVDEAGNYGEPSNVAPIWIESKKLNKSIDCSDSPIAERQRGSADAVSSTYASLFICLIALYHYTILYSNKISVIT